jgi:hypothetical protein
MWRLRVAVTGENQSWTDFHPFSRHTCREKLQFPASGWKLQPRAGNWCHKTKQTQTKQTQTKQTQTKQNKPRQNKTPAQINENKPRKTQTNPDKPRQNKTPA